MWFVTYRADGSIATWGYCQGTVTANNTPAGCCFLEVDGLYSGDAWTVVKGKLVKK